MDDDCIFCSIVAKKAEADILYEDRMVIAFRDIAKKAPFHVLVIPKKHIENKELPKKDREQLVGQMVVIAGELARVEGYDGYKLVWNIGKEAGQIIPHGHVHVLAGKNMRDV